MAARKKDCAPDYDTLTRDQDGDLVRFHARGTFKASNCCGALPIIIGDGELVCRRCFGRLHSRFMSKAVNIGINNKESDDMADTDTTPTAPAPKRPVRKPVTKPKFDKETITRVPDPEPTPAPAPKRAPRKPAAKPAGGPVDPGHKPATSKGAVKPKPVAKPATPVKPRPKAAPVAAPAADSTILFAIKAGKDYVAPIGDDDEVYLMPSLRDAQTFTTAAAATRWANSKRVTRLDGQPTDLVKVTKPAGRGRPSTTVVKPLA